MQQGPSHMDKLGLCGGCNACLRTACVQGCLLLPSGLRGRLPGLGNMGAEGLVMKNKEATSRELRCGSGGREAEGPRCNFPALRKTGCVTCYWALVVHTFNLYRSRWISDFKASRIYRMSSKTTRTTHKETLSEKKNNKKLNKILAHQYNSVLESNISQ